MRTAASCIADHHRIGGHVRCVKARLLSAACHVKNHAHPQFISDTAACPKSLYPLFAQLRPAVPQPVGTVVRHMHNPRAELEEHPHVPQLVLHRDPLLVERHSASGEGWLTSSHPLSRMLNRREDRRNRNRGRLRSSIRPTSQAGLSCAKTSAWMRRSVRRSWCCCIS